MGLFEALGREADAAAHLRNEYRRLLSLVAQMNLGKVNPKDVEVDLTAESWTYIPAAAQAPATPKDVPAEPVTVNPGT